MSETCIVCLGDLGESASAQSLRTDQLVHGDNAKLRLDVTNEVDESLVKPSQPRESTVALRPDSFEIELIAHLLPCGHNLHNECLKPWVERANSCPICRQKFNQVELVKDRGGLVISSYAVKDRTQVADLDPSILFDEEEEPEFQPCRICGSDDNEDVLLICDGCSTPHHTYCVELSEIPRGTWFCEECALNRAIEDSISGPQPTPMPSAARRTRQQLRMNREHILARSSDWARIWETVFSRTTIDLDFPFHNEDSQRVRSAHRNSSRNFNALERRLRVAEEQGAAEEFRNIAPLLDHPTVSRPRLEPEHAEPESLEEVIAWNALEKARDIDADPSGESTKRKSTRNSSAEPERTTRKRRRTRSVTTSPSSPHPPAEPVQRKRPRTRRGNDVAEVTSDGGESLGSRRIPRPTDAAGRPSFLQSLLREVETSPPTDEVRRGRPRLSLQPGYDFSPQGSSPEASPTNSNLPSPRGLSTSPAPSNKGRPGSPGLLTSRIEPIYPLVGSSREMSPTRCDNPLSQRPKLKAKSRSKNENRTRHWVQTSIGTISQQADDLSPTRANMTLSAKERVQKLVKEALKEPYQANKIDKDQYTNINRNISRMLYDRVAEAGDIDGEQSDDWRRIASEEVAKAVEVLQQQKSTS